MSLYDLGTTSITRKKNTANFLQEEAVEREKAHKLQEETAREEKKNKTFVPNMRSRKSIHSVGKKELVTKAAVKSAAAFVVTRLVTESMPVDLSHLSIEELNEQISTVKTDLFDEIINESSLYDVITLKSPTLKDIDSTKINDYLSDNGNSAGVNPANLLAKIITLNALETFKSGDNTTNASLHNAIITTRDVDVPDNENQLMKLRNVVSDVNNKFITVFSKQIQNNVKTSFNKDANDISINENKYLGLSESVVVLRKAKERKATKQYSVSAELFKNAAVLQETHGASPSDYLNEAFFQMCILETYRMLGCVSLSDEEITLKLKNKRSSFSK